MATKIKAPASCGPTREMALLTAEATPELSAGTAVIRAAVRGATMIMSPMPNSTNPGNRSVAYEPAGAHEDRCAKSNGDGRVVFGTRANQATPCATMAAPTHLKRR